MTHPFLEKIEQRIVAQKATLGKVTVAVNKTILPALHLMDPRIKVHVEPHGGDLSSFWLNFSIEDRTLDLLLLKVDDVDFDFANALGLEKVLRWKNQISLIDQRENEEKILHDHLLEKGLIN